MRLEEVPFPEIGRPLFARPGTSDRKVIDDARAGRYDLPPESMPPPRSVLDLGANVGVTAARYAHLWPGAEIVGVEMDYWNVMVAERNAPSVRFRREAVSGTGGIASYDPGVEAEAYRLLPFGAAGENVPSYTLRQIILRSFEHPLKGDPIPVDFVKADVEGAEWDILAHPTWAPLVRHLLVELHPLGAPDPPPEPWPEGRDGPSPLLAAAIPLLRALGFVAVPHVVHPAAVWAVRE